VVGATLIFGGLLTHALFEEWAAPYAGRIEMGQFACLEALLYAAGLGLALVSLLNRPPNGEGRSRAAGWVLWAVAAVVAVYTVLWRLPP
jgi:hypothetical protein